MRVAVITDIHGNLPALEAALAAIEAIGVDEIYCGGDLVGYGPRPNEVCALIEDLGIPTIYGNYDYAIGRDLTDCGCAYITLMTATWGSSRWTGRSSTPMSARRHLCASFPFELRFAMGDQRVRLVHGSPRKVNEYLFEDKPESLYNRLAASADCDVLVFGHTHKPWIHTYGGVKFVNCGSVGKPKDGDPRGGLCDPRTHRWTCRGVDRARAV